jgi:hypothetical protein
MSRRNAAGYELGSRGTLKSDTTSRHIPGVHLLFGICKRGIILVAGAYSLLVVSAIVALIWPHSAVSKAFALIAYCLLAALFNQKLFRLVNNSSWEFIVASCIGTRIASNWAKVRRGMQRCRRNRDQSTL